MAVRFGQLDLVVAVCFRKLGFPVCVHLCQLAVRSTDLVFKMSIHLCQLCADSSQLLLYGYQLLLGFLTRCRLRRKLFFRLTQKPP